MLTAINWKRTALLLLGTLLLPGGFLVPLAAFLASRAGPRRLASSTAGKDGSPWTNATPT